MVNRAVAIQAVKLLGRDHARVVIRMAQEQDKLENKWLSRTDQMHRRIVRGIEDSLRDTGKPTVNDKLIMELLFEHYIDINKQAAKSAEHEMFAITKKAHLAKIRVPRSLAEIRKAYDLWRRRGILPKGFKEVGAKIKTEYVKKTQAVWKKYSYQWREGEVADQENVLRKVAEAADTVESRAKTIVRTETTNYYNKTRRAIYDQSEAVTHYLFLAIRDQRTTKWCSERVVNGKRGRHGLVYAKADPITDAETPACHWNCRSEMVPLSPFNPRHLRLIEDMTLHRRNHQCHALPEGWAS